MTVVNKGLILCCMVVLSFFCFQNVANASVLVEEIAVSGGHVDGFSDERGDGFANTDSEDVQNNDELCDAIFGDPDDSQYPAYWMQWILNIIKYVAIAALLVLSTVDFIKALVSNDKDAIKKATMTTAKRFIFVVILFFLPIIIDFIMRLFGAYGTCGIG